MTKPVSYYVSSTSQINQLCERYGSQLDLLNREQNLQLRIILTYFIWGFEQMGENYSINDAWNDSLQHLLCEDEQIQECLDILRGITINDAEALQSKLLAQCRYGNARLKTGSSYATKSSIVHE